MNHVTLIGRAGGDPELRYTGAGKPVANFSLATDEGWGDKKRTEWHKLVLWEKAAEIAQKFVRKGDQVAVEGRIQSRQYDAKDGSKRTSFEIVVTRLHLLVNDRADEKPIAPGAVEEDIPF